MSVFRNWSGVAGNVPKLFGLQACRWFLFYMPIIALFYMENGLSVGQIMLVQAIYSFTIALAEVPSGYFADSIGRRNSLVVGMLLNLVGVICLSQVTGFITITLSAIVIGLGSSFISGTNSALLYDSLLQIKQSDAYLKYQGRLYSAGTFAEATAAVIGGWMAQYAGYRSTVYAQIFIVAIGVLLAWSLVEVKSEKEQPKRGWANILSILDYAMLQNIRLRWLIVLSAVLGSATLTAAWFAQPFLSDQQFSDGSIGLIWSALNLTVAIISFEAYRVYGMLNNRQISILLVLGVAVGFAGVGLFYSHWALGFIFLIYVMRGIASPVLLDFVNKATPSDMRATVLSVRGLIIRVVFAVVAPFLGWWCDVYSIQQAFLLAGVIFLVLGGVSVLLLRDRFG